MSAIKRVSVLLERPEPQALALIPEKVARRLCVMPLRIVGNTLAVASPDPADALAFDELRVLTGMDIEVLTDTEPQISEAITRHYRMAASVRDAMSDFSSQPVLTGGGGYFHDEEDLSLSPDAPPVVRLFCDILEQAANDRASDVHVEPRRDCTVVRMRIDGRLCESLRVSSRLHPALTTRIKITSGMDIAEKRRPQDGRTLVTHGGKRIDMRVSSVPSVFGEKIVLRLLDQGGESMGIEGLGFDPEQRDFLVSAAKMGGGMFLITGPTGSGKSTTLYSLLGLMNEPEVNIVTIEDPVEYTIDGITQIQVNEKSGVTFPSVLRSVLRQDPDKLMIGEIRDAETASLAVRAAMTGHTVLSTLHTNDAASAVGRLVDIGIAPFLLASSLRGVAAQRLVRKLCVHCRREVRQPAATEPALPLAAGGAVYEAAGCALCRYTGYSGRTVIAEVMAIDSGLSEMIMRGAHAGEYVKYARERGMKSMLESAAEKISAGITSVGEALDVMGFV